MTPSAHTDPFARDHLPPQEFWPDFITPEGSVFDYPERLNCAVELLDKMVEQGHGDSPLIHTDDRVWTYSDFLAAVNKAAHVLVVDLGLLPGNRVLLRGPNTPMLAVCWFAVVKAGGICVATMPLLRAYELTYTCEKVQIELALCDGHWADEMDKTAEESACLKQIVQFSTDSDNGLESRMESKPDTFEPVDTAADDVVLIAFTSGTTGQAKATMHFHRDVMAICDAFPRSCMSVSPDDIFVGTPPLAFTFGLGGLLLFPMRFGASAAFVEKPGVDTLLDVIRKHKATVCFTSPTAYRGILTKLDEADISSLRTCVSAGETLPAPTFHSWLDATGIKIIDGIGATEMLHIFISASVDTLLPGATGKAIHGYEAKVMDDTGNEVEPGTVGALAVRGVTGCRYLDDLERQRQYARNGWNYTGDAYVMDEEGYFHYQARTDDMIISSGYNIAGPEVENALLKHDAVAECGVVGAPDEQRGQIVKAFVVLCEGFTGDDAMAKELQDFVKAEIAPYKYPRALEFMDVLPRGNTGKLQRFRLRETKEKV